MAGRKRKYESTKIKLNYAFEEALAVLVNIPKQYEQKTDKGSESTKENDGSQK